MVGGGELVHPKMLILFSKGLLAWLDVWTDRLMDGLMDRMHVYTDRQAEC